MSYCRYCGREITYKRTKNDRWLPCDVAGNPHFCKEENKDIQSQSGLVVCKRCGKPCFHDSRMRLIDYTALLPHECKAGDVTRYRKYLARKARAK